MPKSITKCFNTTKIVKSDERICERITSLAALLVLHRTSIFEKSQNFPNRNIHALGFRCGFERTRMRCTRLTMMKH